jgi:Zn finger protein HypA/HybF involved in hydrogenase expression
MENKIRNSGKVRCPHCGNGLPRDSGISECPKCALGIVPVFRGDGKNRVLWHYDMPSRKIPTV